MNASTPLQDPQIRFIFDNLVDGIKDQSVFLWEVLDTHTGERQWILGRKLGETTNVMPLALLLPETPKTVARYAPARGDGTWDSSRIVAKDSVIIKP